MRGELVLAKGENEFVSDLLPTDCRREFEFAPAKGGGKNSQPVKGGE